MNIVPTLVSVLVLAVITLAIVLALRLEHPWLQPIAILRAVVQLGILSLILAGIIHSPELVGVFLAVMIVAAVWTVARRLRLAARGVVLVACIVIGSTAIPVAIVFLTGGAEFSPRYVLAVAVAGIVIGNAMTIATLMGRSLAAERVLRRDELEAWFSLGATPRGASAPIVRHAASTALIPSTDQTRTTGIVTLPGAFVGSIFAGASPLAAAEFQLIVLAAILATGALTVAGFGLVFGAPTLIPVEEQPLA